jgi:hypothetical protein
METCSLSLWRKKFCPTWISPQSWLTRAALSSVHSFPIISSKRVPHAKSNNFKKISIPMDYLNVLHYYRHNYLRLNDIICLLIPVTLLIIWNVNRNSVRQTIKKFHGISKTSFEFCSNYVVSNYTLVERSPKVPIYSFLQKLKKNRRKTRPRGLAIIAD